MALHQHQPGVAQYLEVMGNRWLTDASLRYDLIHTQPGAAADAHYLLPCFIREHLGKFHRIHVFNYIDVCLYVKRLTHIKKPFGVFLGQSNFLI